MAERLEVKCDMQAPDSVEPSAEVLDALGTFGRVILKTKCIRPGSIGFRFNDNASYFCLKVGPKSVEVTMERPKELPLLEVKGDARRILAILDGTLDARKAFFDGGIRVFGDLGYLSDLGKDLGLLSRPL